MGASALGAAALGVEVLGLEAGRRVGMEVDSAAADLRFSSRPPPTPASLPLSKPPDERHLAPLEAVLAGRPRLTHCGVWLCALVLYDVASFLRCSQTWQRRFRPVYGFCPLALAPLNRAPRALAHPSPRRSAILECLSAPRALAGARKVPRMARRGHARIISVETHRLPFLGYLWRWVLVLILTLISQLCRPRRCNAPGQAARNHWRAAVSTTPIRNSSTTAPDARLGAWAR